MLVILKLVIGDGMERTFSSFFVMNKALGIKNCYNDFFIE